MRISDGSSDVCSSDLRGLRRVSCALAGEILLLRGAIEITQSTKEINFPSRNTGLDRIDVQSPADAVCRSAAVFCARNGSASREARSIPFKSCTSIRPQTWREIGTLHLELCERMSDIGESHAQITIVLNGQPNHTTHTPAAKQVE